MRLLTLLFIPFIVMAASIEAPLEHVDETHATITIPNIDVGVSGFIVRSFNERQRAIIASAEVSAFDANNTTATLKLSSYDGLRQNSLPRGRWRPKVGDTAVLAYAYERAYLIAPTDDIYHEITSRITTIQWVHADGFAAFLAYRGHGTPLAEDMQDYCAVASVGLLYMYVENALFTLDCKSLSLLDITPFAQERSTIQLPFYSAVKEIPTAWFGSGSSALEAYDPYYMELLVLNNPHNEKLFSYLKNGNSKHKVLLDQFDIEEDHD